MQLSHVVRQNLVKIVSAYCAATGSSRAAVSKRFYGRSDFLEEFRRGKQSISIDKLTEIIEALQKEWPPEAEWPMLPVIHMGRRN